MIEIQELPARTIIGMSRPFIPAVEPGSNAPSVIGPLWGEMSKVFFGLNATDNEYPIGVGAMWPSDRSGEMIYFAGYEVAEVPESLGGLEVLQIAAGKFATVTHTDSLDTMSQTVTAFYSDLLPISGLQRRDGVDLELYIETGAPDFSSKAVIAAPIL